MSFRLQSKIRFFFVLVLFEGVSCFYINYRKTIQHTKACYTWTKCNSLSIRKEIVKKERKTQVSSSLNFVQNEIQKKENEELEMNEICFTMHSKQMDEWRVAHVIWMLIMSMHVNGLLTNRRLFHAVYCNGEQFSWFHIKKNCK